MEHITLFPEIQTLVTQVKSRLVRNAAGKDRGTNRSTQIPWRLYDLVWSLHGRIPSSYDHVGLFHAAVAGSIAHYDDDVAEYVGNSEQAFAEFCKQRELMKFFARKEPEHW